MIYVSFTLYSDYGGSEQRLERTYRYCFETEVGFSFVMIPIKIIVISDKYCVQVVIERV